MVFKFLASFFKRETIVDYKKLVIAAIAVFFVYEFIDFTVHSLILAPTYMKMQHVWRSDVVEKMWIMYITAIVFSFKPPIGRTFPTSDNSPVIARFAFSFLFLINDKRHEAIVIPAEGPSLGVAPSGI